MTVAAETGAWCLPGVAAGTQVDLYCLAHAGGSAAFFRDWQRLAPAHVHVRPIELPGHGRRLHEQPHRRLGVLAQQLIDGLLAQQERPFTLFGHSMGGLLAYEVTRRLHRQGGPLPRHLNVSAISPPDGRAREPMHLLVDDLLLDRLRDFGGTPPEILGHPDLIRLFLPVLRADFEMIATYAEPPQTMPVPLTVFGGGHDTVAPPARLLGWRRLSPQAHTLILEGDHFYLAHEAKRMLAVMGQQVEAGGRPA